MEDKLYIKKFIRDDGETLSFDGEEIYLAEKNTLLVRANPATTAVEYTESDGGEMIRQRNATYTQTINGLIVPKTSTYWDLETQLSLFFKINHTYKIIYVKKDGSMFAISDAWISMGLQIVPVPHETYSEWSIDFTIGNNGWREYMEDESGKEIYANNVVLPLISAASGGEVWESVEGEEISGEGSKIVLDDTKNGATITSLEFYGDTEQQTYSGKNLWGGYTTYARTSSDVNFSTNSDGTITANGTASAVAFSATGQVAYQNGAYITLSAGTYYLSTKESVPSGVTVQIVETTNSATIKDGLGSFTLSATTNIVVRLKVASGTSFTTTTTIYPMVEANNTATDYEPYVGGNPAPNPDYPQDIHVVTGEQTINVVNRNLLGYDYVSLKSLNSGSGRTWDDVTKSVVYNGVTYKLNDDGSITANGTASGASYLILVNSLPLKVGDSYILNGCPSGGSTSTYSIRLYDGGNYTTDSGNGLNFTYGTQNIVRINISNGTVANNIVFKPMIRNSSDTNTTYEPYQSQSYTIDLGSIELAKIGTHQDYIYKSGDDWYIHKEINYAQEDCAIAGITLGSTGANTASDTGAFLITNTSWNNAGGDYDNTIAFARLSTNCGQYLEQTITSNDGARNMIDGTFCQRSDSNNRIYFRFSTFAGKTGNEVKSILQSQGGAEFYYYLATPTDTKITNNTLIGQLEALFGATGYNGKTIITISSSGTNLPAILAVTMQNPTISGEVWDNVGTEWEMGNGGVQTVNIASTQAIYPVWVVEGPCINPKLQNNTTDTIAEFDGTVATGQTLTVDFEAGTAYLDSALVTRYVAGIVSFVPGENMAGFNSDGGATQESTISWNNIIN